MTLELLMEPKRDVKTHLRNMVGAPEEDTLVFRSGCDVATVGGEAGLDLRGHVGVALVLADHAQVPEVVQPDAGVVAGDQDSVLPWHGLYARHLPPAAVLAPRALDVDSGVIFKLICREEYHTSVIGAHHHKLA